ncbi:MAG: hypothetical protein AAGA48_05335 [Myxococcota bacterium]
MIGSMLAFALAALIGCRSGSSEPGTDVPLDDLGWVADVAQTPQRFATLMSQGREGWVSLHAHDYRSAVKAFGAPGSGRFRAQLALATFYDDLARLTGFGTGELFDAWKERGSLPKGPEAPLIAALAASCADRDPAGWATQVTSGPDLALAQRLRAGDSPMTTDRADTPVGQRMALHAGVRAGDRAPEALLREAAEPLLVKDEGDFRREYWDPCVAPTLAERAMADTLASLEAMGGAAALVETGLAATLFASWPRREDVRRVLGEEGIPLDERVRGLGAASALLDRLGPINEDSDDVDSAKDWLRRLDRALDHWGEQLRNQIDDDGRALLADLQLIGRLRQEVVIVQAREALRRGHPRQAWAMLEQARDPSEGLGPANPPALYALLAEAHLRLGRTREAMDAVQPLVEVWPVLQGTRETLGDWAVLKGLDRRGDSKENP